MSALVLDLVVIVSMISIGVVAIWMLLRWSFGIRP